MQRGGFESRPSFGMAACVFRSVEILSVARNAGFDFLVADMEHGAVSLADAAMLCVVGREAGFPVHVRVPSVGCDDLSRVVDCGASGLIVPHVDRVDEARDVVRRVRFAPVGARSIPPPIASFGFRPTPAREVVTGSANEFEVAVMIESAGGLASVRAIAAIDGVDTILIGANDLAQSLGHLGDLAHPRVEQAFSTVAQAAAEHGRRFGVMGVPAALLRSHAIDLQASRIVLANDINLIFEAAAASVEAARGLCGAGPSMPA